MSGQLNAGMRKTNAVAFVVSCAARVVLVLLLAGMVAMLAVAMSGCADKKVNPYTGRQASLDVAKEDHAAAGEQLEEKIKEIATAAVKTQAEELDAARAREAERVRRFEFERGKLEREFAARRAVTQAEHENSVADLAMARDADVAAFYAAAKVAGDDAQRAALSQVATMRETYAAHDKFMRDWQREWEDELSKWTLGIDVAKGVAGVVPGGGAALPLIETLGGLLLGAGGATVVTQRRARKRNDETWDEAERKGYERGLAERNAADAAWDESAKRSQPDPTVALVTSLTTAMLQIVKGNNAPASPAAPGASSPANPASKDAA